MDVCISFFLFSHYLALPNLQRINISHTCVSDSAMNVLATRCPHLLSIDLSGCQEITDVSLSLLAQHCPLLQHIKLSGCPHVSDTGVQLIAQETKHHLLSLDLDECPAITDKTLLFLGYYCANISSLHLKNTRVTAGVLSKLLSSRFKLRELNVQGLPINDNFLFLLSRFQPYLEILDISFCYNITSQGIRKIILDEVFMQEIHLFGLPASITDEAVKCSDSCGNQKLFLFFWSLISLVQVVISNKFHSKCLH